MSNINNNLGYVVEKAKNPATFVEQCEGRYNKIIENIAKQVVLLRLLNFARADITELLKISQRK